MAERLLQPPETVRVEAKHLARAADPGVDRDRLAWVASGGQVGRATLLALLASGVHGKVMAWASKSYGALIDNEHEAEVRALTAATVEDDGAYFGICDPAERDRITAVVRASADGLAHWTGGEWVDVPPELTPVGLPYRELTGELLADAITAAASGHALMLRATNPRAFLPCKGPSPLVAASGPLPDGVYAAVDEADTTAVLALVQVDGAAQYVRTGGGWVFDDTATLPWLVASGVPLAAVPAGELPQLLRTFDDHEAVFPLVADTAPPADPQAAGLAVKAADTGRVLMLQRAYDDTGQDPAAGDWEFPGGGLEPGEDPYDAACREWAEETGMPVPADGQVTGAWRSPDGVYQGHVLTVPSEFDPTDGRDQVTNPDDPDGDQVESIAWWEPQDLQDNPAVRPELSRDLPVVLPALEGDQPEEGLTAARHQRGGAFRFRHGWIPIGGAPMPGGGVANASKVEGRGKTAKIHEAAHAHAQGVLSRADDAAKMDRLGIGDTDIDGSVLHYRGSMGVDRGDMPQLSGNVGGRYLPSAEVTPKFLDHLRSQGVKVTSRAMPADQLHPTQTTGDPAKIRQMADRFKSGASKPKAVVVSSDNRVLDGHHNWAGQRLADAETGHTTPMPVHQVDMTMADLLKQAAAFSGSQGIKNRKQGEFANPDFAMTNPVPASAALVADSSLEDDEAFTTDGQSDVTPPPDDPGGYGDDTGDTMMVGLPVTDQLGQALATDGGLDPGEMHVTLVVLGTPDDAGVGPDELAQMVADWAAGQDHVSGELAGPATFAGTGNEDNPAHVALVDVPTLPAMRDALAHHLLASGVNVPPDEHGYTPHITRAYGTEPPPDGFGGTPVEFGNIGVYHGPRRVDIPFRAAPITAAKGHHVPGTPYRFRHGWKPIGGPGGGVGISSEQHAASQAAQVEHHVARTLASNPETARRLRQAGVSPAELQSRVLSRMRGETPPRTGPERFGPEDSLQFTSRSKPSPGSPERFGPPDELQFTSTRPSGQRRRMPGQRRSMPFSNPPPHQPLTDQQYEAHTHAVEKALAEAVARGENTDAKYAIDVDKGLWQPERADIHKKIADDIYQRQAATAKSTGDALIMGGLGGAGKSTVLKNHLGLDSKDWVTINPDDVKEEMARMGLVPDVAGLSPMEASALIHEESSHIANIVAAMALKDHKNIIYDITMSSKGSVAKRLDKLAEHGYKKPQGVFVDIPVETSVSRALGRHRHGLEEHRQGKGSGGRYVPPSVIRKSGSSTSNSANRDVFDALAGRFGTRRIFDTSGNGAVEVKAS